jgi:hypothetical protein
LNEFSRAEIETPFNYEEVPHESKDWENIPIIVPKFCINMSKHIESISSYLESKNNDVQAPDVQMELKLYINVSMSSD